MIYKIVQKFINEYYSFINNKVLYFIDFSLILNYVQREDSDK